MHDVLFMHISHTARNIACNFHFWQKTVLVTVEFLLPVDLREEAAFIAQLKNETQLEI